MERQSKAIALIRDPQQTPVCWLLARNTSADRWDFVIADQLENESLRESVRREVAWRLNLDPRSDLLVSNMAHLNVEYSGQGDAVDTDHPPISLAFYSVELYGNNARTRIAERSDVCWVTSQEIYAEKAADGRPMDAVSVSWIKKWQVIQEWDSDEIV